METTKSKPEREQNLPVSTGLDAGREDLADHVFQVPVQTARRDPGAVAEDTGAPPPEDIQPGGKIGTVPGDHQRRGDVGAIMDQVSQTTTDIVDH